MDKINNFTLYSTPLDATTPRISPSVADTGAAGTFLEMNAPYITNIKETDPGIKVLCPNNQYLTSTHTVNLSFPNLPPTAKSAHLFEQLTSGSHLSIGQLCDAGCEAFFDATRMVILSQQKIVLIGTRKRGGLWYVDTTDSTTQTPNFLRNFFTLLSNLLR